jgi:hypothetical protein
MTVAQLKEEAKARSMDPKTTPKIKSDLLNVLVEGSICVHESPEFKAYQGLLKRVEKESVALREEMFAKNRAAEQRKEAMRAERYAREEREREEAERKKAEERLAEMVRQKSLHIHSFPKVYDLPLAKTSDLSIYGNPRSNTATCDLCEPQTSHYSFFPFRSSTRPNTAHYTCESRDWDICEQCFQEENKNQAEKDRIKMEREEAREEQRRKEIEEEEKEEEERRNRYDAEVRFSSSIRKVTGEHLNAHLNPESYGLKYAVWCSDGYDNDGWHSYEGEPPKEFDSVWETKEDANKRAEYLFYWKSPWGLEAEEIYSDAWESTAKGDLKGWTVRPADSSRWTVGVVPSEAFLYLDNATRWRHNFDKTEDEQSIAWNRYQNKRLKMARKTIAPAREEKEEEDCRNRYDAEVRFSSSIRKVTGKHLDPQSSGMKYTVWCSDGYDNDGWHSYNGEPDKEFDSVWETKEDANKRAEYLFYWKSPWGLEAEEMHEKEWESWGRGDLWGRTVCPADSSRWTVAVVPSKAFLYLDNATKKRHDHDDGRCTSGSGHSLSF